jgi:predicted ATPase
MAISITFLEPGQRTPSRPQSPVYLEFDNWDDFGYKTLFKLLIFDEDGKQHEMGNVKIAFIGQNQGRTFDSLPEKHLVETQLPEKFYSLGQDADYYKNLFKLPTNVRDELLRALRDIVFDESRMASIENEPAFVTSLLRDVAISSIEQQFTRILRGDAPLTKYDFFYEKGKSEKYSGIKIKFSVNPDEKPTSNIHVLIGRNGVGKTTLLNNMVDALISKQADISDTGWFGTTNHRGGTHEVDKEYFAGVVSVSFSAFDSFTPPPEQSDNEAGIKFSYIGLKQKKVSKDTENWILKDKEELCTDFIHSLNKCFSLVAKKARWIKAVKTLESDLSFAEMELCSLANIEKRDDSPSNWWLIQAAQSIFMRMSSGHGIVLLTMTKLIETVEEKTLVLMDEPESHLHPPLLSAFTRALSDLLVNRNGVGIIATHSPVVLQEVPVTCVSILRRTRLIATVERPEIETFAENVGILTREVFGLEVSKSGFHKMLAESVDTGKSYDEILQEYHHQLGFEGKTILRSMIISRDNTKEDEQ